MNGTSKILIVEDEVLIAEFVKEMLEDEGFKMVKMANDRDEALMLFRSFVPEIILMDINIDGRDSGIELAMSKNPEAQVIFLTAQSDAATIQKALATQPQGYLTKPMRKPDLMATIALVGQQQQTSFISIKSGYDVIKLPVNDVLYIKSDNVYLDIYTRKKKYSVRQTLEKFLLDLDSSRFCRTHRSYIVNRSAVTRTTSKAVYINDIEIPLSRNFTIEM